jgi:hypothetical protein
VKRLRQECPILDSSGLKFSFAMSQCFAHNTQQSPESKIQRKLDMTNDNCSTAADLFTALLRYRSSKTIGDQSRSIPSPARNVHFSALAFFSEPKSEFSVLASLKYCP